jgi:hypothetical protein
MIHKIYQYRLHTKRNNVFNYLSKLNWSYVILWVCDSIDSVSQFKHIVDSFPNSWIYNFMLFINIIDWTVQHMHRTTYTDQAR